jgi:hypothetical protein
MMTYHHLRVDKDAKNPILERVAYKIGARKYTMSELKVALKRSKSDIDQAKKELNVAKKLADDQNKCVVA